MSSWQPVITLDGVDRSTSVVDQVIVTAEESAARTASFTLRPPAGAVSAGDWLGVAVTIDYRTLDTAGTPISTERIFTGIVDRALYDPRTQTTAFECSDNLQESIAALSQSAVDALVPAGRYSEAVFGDYQDGWDHLQNLLSTVPQAYDYSRAGVGQLTDWAAKTVADYSYDSSAIIDGSLAYSLAPRSDMVNRVTVSYDYRFRRYKHREHAYSWSIASGVYGWSFCDVYLTEGHTLPSEDMVKEAAHGTDWKVQGEVSFTNLPPSGWVCNDKYAWLNWPNQKRFAIDAAWTAIRRWTQEATEQYTLTVQAPQSVTWLGAIAREEFASTHTESEDEGWESGTDTPTGGRTDSQGDTVVDGADRTTSDNDIETLIARARCQILDAHRGNWLEGRVELEPTLERSHTAELDGGALAGQGKVIGITHEMDIDSGQASTLIRIAVSLNGGAAAITDDTISAPPAPDTDPIGAPPTINTALQTHFGRRLTSPVYDEAWDGFTGNFQVPEIGSEEYPRRFKVGAPEINQDAIDAISNTQTGTYEFNIPNETLTITVP